MIYLDTAATTKPKKEVIDAMMPYLTDLWHNPSSLYESATKIKKSINNSRKIVGNFINAKENEIYFTSSGSESNCWVIQGFINYCKSRGKTPSIIVSTIEHKSILSCVENMIVDLHYVGVDEQGKIDVDSLENILQYISDNNEILVSIQYANNEIGTIQNISNIANIVHKYNGIFHTDAVQAFGHININVVKEGIDLLSASGHKIGTPKGIGFLYKKTGININPLIYGSQMDGMRGGTENVPYIIGFGKAVELCEKYLKEKKYLHMIKLREYMTSRLIDEFGCKVNGSRVDRLSNNINVTFPNNITGEALIYMLDLCDIYISAGSACNSHSNIPSYVLSACGLSDDEAYKTIRITLPENIILDDIDFILAELKRQIQILDFESK